MNPLVFVRTLFRGLFGQYFFNLRAWSRGWRKFDEIGNWKPGWDGTQLRWKLIYATNYLVTCLVFAGPVATMSWWMNLHRQGKVWDAILDGIEKHDPGHGEAAGGPLWGTKECSLPIRIAAPVLWFLLFRGLNP